MTKAESKAALQAYLNVTYGDGKYTVGDGVEFICPATELETDKLNAYHVALSLATQSMFVGALTLTCITRSVPAEVEVSLTPLMGQADNLYPRLVAAGAVVPVQRSVNFNELVFAYLDGANYNGVFIGYKFEVTTLYSLNEDGRLALGENGQPYEAQ